MRIIIKYTPELNFIYILKIKGKEKYKRVFT